MGRLVLVGVWEKFSDVVLVWVGRVSVVSSVVRVG